MLNFDIAGFIDDIENRYVSAPSRNCVIKCYFNVTQSIPFQWQLTQIMRLERQLHKISSLSFAK